MSSSMRPPILLLISLLCLLWLTGAVAPQAPDPLPSGDPGLLFVDTDASALRSLPAQSALQGVIRTRYAHLNTAALATLGASPLTLNLFSDAAFTVDGVSALRQGGAFSLHAAPVGLPEGDVILTFGTNFVVGRVLSPAGNYYIEPLGESGLHAISEIDIAHSRNDRIPTDALDARLYFDGQTPVQPASALNNTAVEPDNGAIVDLLVVYTPAAQAILGGTPATTEAAILNMVALTNTTHINSGIQHRVRPVHIARTEYVEQPASFVIDINNLTGVIDGQMDEVHALRGQYGADLVMLITGTPEISRNYCGVAWLSYQDPALGFGISEAVCAGTVVMPHELGHNKGASHDRANANPVGFFPFSFGYQDTRTGPDDWADFVTVMAYGRNGQCPPNNPIGNVNQDSICPHIPYWSNPQQTYQGKPLGTADSNNARTLNRTASFVTNFQADAGELLVNGSFEDGLNGWNTVGFSSRDRVQTDSDVRKVARVQTRALRLKGEAGERSRAIQDVEVTDLQTGDVLTLSGWIEGRRLAQGVDIRLRVDYTDPVLQRQNLRLRFPAGTYRYTARQASLQLEGQPARIRVYVRYTNTAATGRALIDGVSLSKAAYGIETDWQPPASAAALPLPRP